MKQIKSFFSVLFSAVLLLSTTTVNSIAIEKLHFVVTSLKNLMPNMI